MEKILISPAEAMELLGVTKSTMYDNLLKREDFPSFKVGARHFINREKLLEWVDKQCTR